MALQRVATHAATMAVSRWGRSGGAQALQIVARPPNLAVFLCIVPLLAPNPGDATACYSVPVRERSIAMNESVCLSVSQQVSAVANLPARRNPAV